MTRGEQAELYSFYRKTSLNWASSTWNHPGFEDFVRVAAISSELPLRHPLQQLWQVRPCYWQDALDAGKSWAWLRLNGGPQQVRTEFQTEYHFADLFQLSHTVSPLMSSQAGFVKKLAQCLHQTPDTGNLPSIWRPKPPVWKRNHLFRIQYLQLIQAYYTIMINTF